MNTSVTLELEVGVPQPGFKPFLWKLASDAGFGGWVTDSPEKKSVLLHLCGNEADIRSFVRLLPGTASQYKIRDVNVLTGEFSGNPPPGGSASGGRFKVLLPGEWNMPEVAPDSIPCPDCVAEVLNPESRRFRYPFFACARCGSSYSALLRNPFSRHNTVYCSFPPCQECRSEETNRQDPHHFGAPLLTCPVCGPRLFLLDSEGEPVDDTHCIENARKALSEGKILALQSMFGGFQLFVDGRNSAAIRELRLRRKIPVRPLSVMARNLEAVQRVCFCSPSEEQLLVSKAAPVVILDVREDVSDNLPFGLLCPDGMRLGISLPPTLMMRLLFEQTAQNDVPAFDYLVTVSSNWTGGFTLNGVDELLHSLHGVADVFLCHDLRIGMDSPASVAVVRDGAPQIWRRSRGYAPRPVRAVRRLKRNAAAFGSDLNSSVSLAGGDKIVLSQHLGDILSVESAGRLSSILERYMVLFDTVPDAVVCDMNPHLRSSEEARRFANRFSLPVLTVETHHAHALSGMAENRLDHVLAVVFGNGEPGADGNLWGAELLDASITSYRRLATFAPVCLSGRESSLTRPVKQLAGRLTEAGVVLTPALMDHYRINPEEAQVWHRWRESREQLLQTHAAARLFDAVAAGLGVAPAFIGYRGQSAVRLEYAARRASGGLQGIPEWMYHKFDFDQRTDESGKIVIDWAPLFRNFADPSWITPENTPQLALAFHVKIADAVSCMVSHGEGNTGLRDVLLTGSLFMNGILQKIIMGKLRAEKYRVFIHRSVPMDESGLSAGQAFYGAWQR